ncbi:MAG: TraM recognition domain-containing protein [Gammaproteobacteria bacterium]
MAKYMYKRRGLDKRHEQDPRQLIRDTRTLGQRVSDFFADSMNAALVMGMSAVAAFVFPMVADFVFIVAILVFCYAYTRKTTLPFRMPLRAHTFDYNDIKPGTTKPNMSRGICFFGNEIDTNEELWFNNEDMRTHVLIFGSTGSGKTEALVSIAYNSLLYSSGFIYVDGKGDNSLFAKIFSMARRMGREDDVLLVNFMTSARDIVGKQEKRLSNTLNPFSTGSSSMLSQLVVSLMDSSSQSSDGDMWKGRAISFIEALMKILAYMRDQEHILLDANTVRNYFTLERLESIVMDRQFPRDNQEPVSLEKVPDIVMEPIANYLFNLPGYDKSKKGKQVSQVLEQHGFITMQLTRVFTSLADTYGHIMRTNLAEVDLRDVVLNRRILVVLLPALEKSPEELANLGKVIIASLKAMMSSGLGSDVEGTYRDLIQRKPTNANTPFFCILDEYGYYAVPGFAVVPAQARSLGFSTIFAGQDLPAFQKASKEEAASIGANTNIKIAMKLEDPVDTWDFFAKTAGEAYVTKVDAFQTNAQSLTNSYLDTRSASAEKRARIELLDLKEQREGEAHIFFKSKIVRASMFYANPPSVKYMRLNHLLKVARPAARVLVEMEKREDRFEVAVNNFSDMLPPSLDDNEEIQKIQHILEGQDHAETSPIERSIQVLMEFDKSLHGDGDLGQEETLEMEELTDEELNIFAEFREGDPMVPMVLGEHNMEWFKQPLLRPSQTHARMEYIERLAGRSTKHAHSVAEEIIKDMRIATYYPPMLTERQGEDAMVALVNDLSDRVANRVSEEAE